MPGRGGIWAAKLLGDYRGILQVDGYEAYGQFGRSDRSGGPATLAYCWAHVRRGFFDAAKGKGAPIAEEALRRIGALYEIERDIRGRGPDGHLVEARVRLDNTIRGLCATFGSGLGSARASGSSRACEGPLPSPGSGKRWHRCSVCVSAWLMRSGTWIVSSK